QRRLGVDAVVADMPDGRIRDGAVVHHQDVRVDERGDVAGRAFGNARAHFAQLLLGAAVRAEEAHDFALDVGRCQRVFGNVQLAAVHLLHVRDGDAARNADAGQPQTHGTFPVILPRRSGP